MWTIGTARTKNGHQNMIYGAPNFNFINSLIVVYDKFERVHLRPYIMLAFKPLKTATHQNARPASYSCISLQITHKIWITAYDFGPHNTQWIYRYLYRRVPRDTV